MNFMIGYPVDGGNADSSFIVKLWIDTAKTHSCLGGAIGGLSRKSGAAFVWERVPEYIQDNYCYVFDPIKPEKQRCTPKNICDSGFSDAAACALAVAQCSQPTDSNPPLILISCSFCNQDRRLGLTGLKLEKVTLREDPRKSEDTLKNKWAAVCKNNALALVLHEFDAKLLSQVIDIEPIKLQKDTFERILEQKKDKREPYLISCQPNQLPDLAEALGVNPTPFLSIEDTGQRLTLEEVFNYIKGHIEKKTEKANHGIQRELYQEFENFGLAYLSLFAYEILPSAKPEKSLEISQKEAEFLDSYRTLLVQTTKNIVKERTLTSSLFTVGCLVSPFISELDYIPNASDLMVSEDADVIIQQKVMEELDSINYKEFVNNLISLFGKSKASFLWGIILVKTRDKFRRHKVLDKIWADIKNYQNSIQVPCEKEVYDAVAHIYTIGNKSIIFTSLLRKKITYLYMANLEKLATKGISDSEEIRQTSIGLLIEEVFGVFPGDIREREFGQLFEIIEKIIALAGDMKEVNEGFRIGERGLWTMREKAKYSSLEKALEFANIPFEMYSKLLKNM